MDEEGSGLERGVQIWDFDLGPVEEARVREVVRRHPLFTRFYFTCYRIRSYLRNFYN